MSDENAVIFSFFMGLLAGFAIFLVIAAQPAQANPCEYLGHERICR